MSLAEEIKEYALELGYCKAGITSADPFEFAAREVDNRGESYDYWTKENASSLKWAADPKKQMPDAKSLIVVAYDYYQVDFPEELSKMIGRAYQARAYMPTSDSEAGLRLQKFIAFLEAKGMKTGTHRMLDRQAAVRAGVATFGRNNFAYVDGVGSFVILYTIAVDQELDYDEPNSGTRCDDNCKNCIRACPTRALYAAYKLKADKCIGFANWMHVPEREGIDIDIPKDVLPQLGMHIHGCDVCQEVCPQNRGKFHSEFEKDDFLEEADAKITLESLLAMEGGLYERYVHPLMYNYITHPKYFQRNAAIAMGNTRDRKYVPALIAQLGNEEEVVRNYVVWALGRIGGEEAHQALLCCQSGEASEKMQAEIAEALRSMPK